MSGVDLAGMREFLPTSANVLIRTADLDALLTAVEQVQARGRVAAKHASAPSHWRLRRRRAMGGSARSLARPPRRACGARGRGGGGVMPRLLDLFCGAGGAGEGYRRAGWDVTGVDHLPHPDAPFPVLVEDAMTVLADTAFVRTFDAVHASPPCQGFTTMSNRWRGTGGKADSHPDLISWVRLGLQAADRPYVIENVPGARAELHDPIVLHGGMFGLGVNRPRLFETNWPVTVARAPRVHRPLAVYGKLDGRLIWRRNDGSEQRAPRTLAQGQAAMGIDWMCWEDLTEAIPPAYNELIGSALLAHVTALEPTP